MLSPRGLPTPAALLLIALVTLVTRLAVLPHSTEANMDADAAHFMNVARCFERGQGFSNPSAWPAWMRPASLPMPETFKEPAYSWLIARLTPIAKSPFRAGQAISFVAGLLIPLLTWSLMRRLHPERGVALVAALLAAASPLLVARSSLVMVESVFAAAFTLLWVTLLAGERRDTRGLALDLAAGVLVGVAFMLRAQTLMAVPAIVVLLLRGGLATGARRGVVIALAAIVAASPFLLRNLKLFGSPLHSDISAFGLMPYVNVLDLQGSLERPPAAIGWALQHVPQVIAHSLESAVRFLVRTLPGEILGNPVWMVPLVAGALLSLQRERDWLWLHVQVLFTMAFVFAVNWDERYFASSVPLWCALAAPGVWWFAERLWPERLWDGLRGRELLLGALVLLVALQTAAARRTLDGWTMPDNLSARAVAPFLKERLKPDEAVMSITTSYHAYWTDRPAVYLILADDAAFDREARRLHVRYVVLPTSRLAEIATHYPQHRFPASWVPDHADAYDNTIFRLR